LFHTELNGVIREVNRRESENQTQEIPEEGNASMGNGE